MQPGVILWIANAARSKHMISVMWAGGGEVRNAMGAAAYWQRLVEIADLNSCHININVIMNDAFVHAWQDAVWDALAAWLV